MGSINGVRVDFPCKPSLSGGLSGNSALTPFIGNPRLAAALALGAAFVLPVADAMMKTLVVEYPVVMVAWARMGLIVVFLGIVGGAQIGARMVRPVSWRLQLLRGFSAVLGTSFILLGF